jgi:hypothetical protein
VDSVGVNLFGRPGPTSKVPIGIKIWPDYLRAADPGVSVESEVSSHEAARQSQSPRGSDAGGFDSPATLSGVTGLGHARAEALGGRDDPVAVDRSQEPHRRLDDRQRLPRIEVIVTGVPTPALPRPRPRADNGGPSCHSRHDLLGGASPLWDAGRGKPASRVPRGPVLETHSRGAHHPRAASVKFSPVLSTGQES